ncbi:KIDINS220 [Symbiodinium microadriaticum]|nr:KIDINS220 [Symbiodinium microadriaticum]
METRNYAPPKGPFIYVTEVRSRTVQQDHNIDRGFRLLSVNGVEATEFTEDPRGVLAAITERLEAPYALRFRQNGPKFLYHAGCGYLCDAGHSLQPHYVGTASCQKGHVLQAVSLETLSETCGTELSCDACCEAIFGPARPTDHSYACLDCLRERQDPPAKAEPRKVDTGQSYQILCPTCTWKLYRKGSTESPYKHLGQVSCQACDRTDLGPDAPKDGPALSDARSFYHCEECWSTGAKSDLCYLCALRQLKCTSGHDLDPLLTSPFAENLHCAVCLANLDAEEEAYHCRDCWWLRGARLDRCVSCAGQNQIRYTLDNDARMQVVPGNSPAGELVAAIPDEGPKANDLVAAAEKGHVEIVRLLLLLKADTGRGHVEMVCLMLEDNPHTDFADTDVADNLGRTALVLASDAGHADIVRLLLEAGASTEVADTGERTALMRAFDGGEITWKKPYEPVAHTRIRGPDGDVQLDVRLKLLGLIYPMGTRLSLSSLFDHREATITNLHETGKYVLSLDGDRKPLVFEPDLTNHVPAGGWRYYPGQKLAVCVKGLWREFKVHSLGEYGSLHMLEETGPKDPSKRQRVEVNLNSYNHTPAWLSASEWWNELCRWEDHLVAGTLATDALTAQPAELLSFEWCLVDDESLREPPTGSCTFGDGIFMHRSALGPSPGKLWAFLHRLTQNSLAREKGQFTAREVVLVLGPVASGKTRLLQRLAVEAVKAHDSEMVPFIVPASRLLLVISIATKTSTETAYMKRHSRAYSKESEQICLKRLADTDFLLIYIRVMFGADSRTTQFLRQALHSRRLLLLVDSLEHCPITLQNPLLNGLARLAVAGHRVVVTGSPSAEIFGTFSQPKEAEEKNTSSSEEDEEEDDNASADELHDPRETGARRPSDADKQRPSVVRGRNSSVVSMDFSALAERAAAETKRRSTQDFVLQDPWWSPDEQRTVRKTSNRVPREQIRKLWLAPFSASQREDLAARHLGTEDAQKLLQELQDTDLLSDASKVVAIQSAPFFSLFLSHAEWVKTQSRQTRADSTASQDPTASLGGLLPALTGALPRQVSEQKPVAPPAPETGICHTLGEVVNMACDILMATLADVRMYRKGVHGAPKPEPRPFHGGGEAMRKALQILALHAQQNGTDRVNEEDALYSIEYGGSSSIMRAFRELQHITAAGNFLLLRRHECWRCWDELVIYYVFPNPCIQGYLASLEIQETWMKPGCPMACVEEAFEEPRWHSLLSFLPSMLPGPLTLRFPRLSEVQANLMAEFFARGPNVSYLNLSGAGLGLRRAALRGVAAALRADRHLLHLDVSSNSLGSEGVHTLCQALLEHPALLEFMLAKNHIGQVGAVKLVDLLRVNLVVQRIDLEDNPIGNEWANYIYVLQKDRSATLASAQEQMETKVAGKTRMPSAAIPVLTTIPAVEFSKELTRLGSVSSRLRHKASEDLFETSKSARTPRLLR